jgi:hypothetical protein
MRVAWFMFLALLSSCSPRSSPEVAGTYTSIGEGMRDTLVLAPDFTYTQDTVRDGTSEHERYTGKWSYRDGGVYLEGEMLHRAWISGSTRTELKRFSGITMLPAERWFGPLKLGSDEGIQYVRAK